MSPDDLETARRRVEELADYDREQRTYRTPPGLAEITVRWKPADPDAGIVTAAEALEDDGWVDVGTARIADLMGAATDQVEKALRELIEVFNRNAEQIREANEILERVAQEPDRRRGRSAQASPYDIGRKR